MLVLVKIVGQWPWLVQVNTTTDATQARWDAYCYCYGDDSPQEAAVNECTSVVAPLILNTLEEAHRKD